VNAVTVEAGEVPYMFYLSFPRRLGDDRDVIWLRLVRTMPFYTAPTARLACDNISLCMCLCECLRTFISPCASPCLRFPYVRARSSLPVHLPACASLMSAHVHLSLCISLPALPLCSRDIMLAPLKLLHEYKCIRTYNAHTHTHARTHTHHTRTLHIHIHTHTHSHSHSHSHDTT